MLCPCFKTESASEGLINAEHNLEQEAKKLKNILDKNPTVSLQTTDVDQLRDDSSTKLAVPTCATNVVSTDFKLLKKL